MRGASAVGICVFLLAAGAVLAATVPAGAQEPPPTTSTLPDTTGTTTTTPPPPPTTTTTTTTAPPPVKPRQPLRLPSGVKIGSLRVGGLSPSTAYTVVRAAFRAPLVLRVGTQRVSVTPSSLGAVAYAKQAIAKARIARPNSTVQLSAHVKGPGLQRLLETLEKRFDRGPIDSKLVLRKLVPFISDGRPGRRLDRRATVRVILEALRKNRRTTIEVPFHEVVQKIGPDDFGSSIVIRRESKRLYLYDKTRLVRVFGVATGQSYYPTPLGRYEIVVKWEHPWWYPPNSPWARDAKPIPPGPGNPLGTRWMGISAPAVGIHGTPDAASIGYSASHGCVRMLISEAEWLFEHVEIGTPVFIIPV